MNFSFQAILTPQAQMSLQGHSVFERMLKYFEQRPMTERRGCKIQNFISFLMVLIILENFEKKFFGRVETLIITNFEHFPLGGVDTLTIKVEKNLWARGNPNYSL